MIATTIVTASTTAVGITARRSTSSTPPATSSDPGRELERRRPRQAETPERVQLPAVEDELHQPGRE